MEIRALGNTGINVSFIGYGAGSIGDVKSSEAEIEQLLNSVLDLGITLIDTAHGYGLSEERIGRYLSHRRQDFILSTKVGYGIPGYHDWTYDCIIAGVDEALRRLRTDYIDIVHLHSCPIGTLAHGEVVEALANTVRMGKVRVAAYSGDNDSLAYAVDSRRFRSIMPSINICDQRAIDRAVVPANDRGIGIIAKRPIANAPWRYDERPVGNYCEEYWVRWHQMQLDTELDWQELALRFTAAIDGVASAIIGTTNLDHLKQNITIAAKGQLPPELVIKIRNAFRQHDNNWVGQI